MGADDAALSIEETNTLRAKLGLAPLKMSAPKSAPVEVVVRPSAPLKQGPAPVVPTKFQRQLLAGKGLGEDDEEEGDLMAWVNKSRDLDSKRRQEEEKKKAREELEARRKRRRAEEGEEEAGVPGYSSKDLAGLKVKQSADEIEVGETVILTLEDRRILGEDGALDEAEDELVNAVVQEDKQRKRARAAAKKQSAVPDYDSLHQADADLKEGALEGSLVINEEGRIAAEERRKEEVRAKLLGRSAALLGGADGGGSSLPGADYLTKEEAEAKFNKLGKKEKKRKLRQKGPSLLEELDLIVGEGGGSEDLGSRAQRAERQQQMLNEEREQKERKAAAFNKALEKANYASLALKLNPLAAAEQVTVGGEEDEDEPELVQRIGRAAGTARPSGDHFARRILESRNEAAAQGVGGTGLVFSNATEFVRGIESGERSRAAGAGVTTAAPVKGEDAMVTFDPEEVEGAPRHDAESGGADGGRMEVDEEEEEDKGGRAAPSGGMSGPGAPTQTAHNATRGLGLGSILGSLRDAGELKQKVEWHGRNTDMKMNPHNEEAVKALFNGADDETGQRVEAALRKVDQFGRILTPKEAFRQMCHTFHGKAPSKLRQEKNIKKYTMEMQAKKQLTATNTVSGVNKQTEVQAKLNTPYLVLEGRLTAGQVVDPTSAYATRERGADGFFAPGPVRDGTASTLGTASKIPGRVGPSLMRPPQGTSSVAPSKP